MMQNPIVRLLFNRGGFGASMSRDETIEHINPLIEQHMRLNRSYDTVVERTSDAALADRLGALQKTARADVGKLAETVLSAGGVAYNGVELRNATFDLGTNEAERLERIRDDEQALYDAATEELGFNHHLRTQAILENVQTHSRERIDLLNDQLKGLRAATS